MRKQMNAWIQKHDFSSEEFTATNPTQAIHRLKAFDWQGEREAQEHSAEETCAPGFGFVVSPGHILHICPGPDDKCSVYYTRQITSKVFLFFSRSSETTKQADDVPFAQVESMIHALFAGNFTTILAGSD